MLQELVVLFRQHVNDVYRSLQVVFTHASALSVTMHFRRLSMWLYFRNGSVRQQNACGGPKANFVFECLSIESLGAPSWLKAYDSMNDKSGTQS